MDQVLILSFIAELTSSCARCVHIWCLLCQVAQVPAALMRVTAHQHSLQISENLWLYIKVRFAFFATEYSCTVLLQIVFIRVVDPHWFNSDPDPAFFLIVNPDQDTYPDPDPVPNPGFWWPKIGEKNYSWKKVGYLMSNFLQATSDFSWSAHR